MKIVVIGGTGLIGTKVVTQLRQRGHQVIAASPATGINTVTGEGLAEAVNDTDVVIDLANSPSFEDKAVMEFFETAGRNLLATEINADVKHHIALSIVGVDVMQNIGYMRAKQVQEDLIKKSGVPYTIIRSTQFFEFLAGIANQAADGNEVHLSDVQFQPIAADDVASFVAKFALAAPVNGKVEIAGPERFKMYEIVARYLQHSNDPRKVVPNDKPAYYGGEIAHTALVPAGQAELGAINFEQWWSKQLQ
ncbi:SDR family oxidoreductase [Flavitalea sp. BT771]|uniref:SDR family oxidoreductase n=1 Tax=Flavitalea sp. BT771 TaxID=3063329 RepID=UPI0026E3D071|nr:SDR family oxidoreductase [Flavitalea sp. BT771]MDO6433664.1 SDR family oxidoreductase [Flavitalea sp. BT771]MDV6222431.1 SDR family oxidoreductase [Flavitalea sp. BT771]